MLAVAHHSQPGCGHFGTALRLFLLALALVVPSSAQRAVAGASEIRLALDRLNSTGSALMIAAHPDDENTALLAWLARGRHVRTGYLSLTRGEGGQNLIGSEQGYLLGVIRTQELLAARRIDGAEQFFSSAVDFGFSKTAEETLARWGREKILGDVVYVIRKFRPDVIILRFSGTPRDGHGHHQSSAILGKEAFSAAADPKRFPEQLSEVQPWQAKRLVWNAFAFNRQQEQEAAAMPGRIDVDLGEYDPLLGYSYSEIAGMSRSQHQSQGMGSPERRGSQKNYLVHVAGEPATKDLFDGIGLRRGLAPLEEASRVFDPRHPEKIIPLLLQARPALTDERSRRELDEAVALCAGLWFDASTDRPYAAPGERVRITAQSINRSQAAVELLSVSLSTGAGLTVGQPLVYNQPVTQTTDWTAEAIQRELPRAAPEPPPLLSAVFRCRVEGQQIDFHRPVWNRYVDRVRGELTRPFEVVPPLSLRIGEPARIFATAAPQPVTVHLRAWGEKRSGTAGLELPPGWTVSPKTQPFVLTEPGQEGAVRFEVTPPAGASTTDAKAVAVVGRQNLSGDVQVIEYPHIPPQTLFPPASSHLVRTDVKVLSKRVGYIMGAGDEVPDALRQIGCDVTLLGPADLAAGDLDRFDAIVTGVRAYNTRPDLRANQHRLLEFVSRGGTMVVQYNVLEGGFGGGNPRLLEKIGPYPIKISRERITVEESPVEVLKAEHPLLTAPNRITSQDWAGWVQERGLYFATEWDPKYEAVISSHDPGEKPLAGGMLFTRVGKGVYVFTAYSWFRQLPAGVPGAYRIFANLLSAGRAQ
jgi:LmbE family N-acetylglucosaminyl deacetylase